jgi:hypothetical protein
LCSFLFLSSSSPSVVVVVVATTATILYLTHRKKRTKILSTTRTHTHTYIHIHTEERRERERERERKRKKRRRDKKEVRFSSSSSSRRLFSVDHLISQTSSLVLLDLNCYIGRHHILLRCRHRLWCGWPVINWTTPITIIMIRKFRKIFRPTTTISTPTKNESLHSTSSPESTSDETHYVKQVSSSINKQLFTGRQNEFFHIFFCFFFFLFF